MAGNSPQSSLLACTFRSSEPSPVCLLLQAPAHRGMCALFSVSPGVIASRRRGRNQNSQSADCAKHRDHHRPRAPGPWGHPSSQEGRHGVKGLQGSKVFFAGKRP
eukprot:scaffold1651_cov317-Pinguiococcus_pyrenoidosus.AAC.1